MGLQGPQGPTGPRGLPGSPGPPSIPAPTVKRDDPKASTKVLTQSGAALRVEGVEVVKTLHYLSGLVQSIRKPLGTRENPARICRDLMDCEQLMADGSYFIDPNTGCASDTIQVTCSFSKGGRTCFNPVSISMSHYDVSRVQMNFLHLLSTEAWQTITVHCLNSPLHGNATAGPTAGPTTGPTTGSTTGSTTAATTAGSGLRFRGWSGLIFGGAGGPLHPRVVRDDCSIQDGRWHQAEFSFETRKATLLPIVEVLNLPTSSTTSQTRLEVGPICFL
ncbi:collagen alpha-1(XXVII) chain-like [Lethenteron reissneri]|uniref:collagen alpha-1(XXVII) chain-like n=1 Tax=Lethenteron reissneri TaxID=7753 RepID=UPI002AB667DE|nr:collagen alpha-1(XXVII) chain-like [Lethenteron reissneri]